MKTIIVNDFSRGIADDRFNGGQGEFSISKHFDILTHPRRLQPLRGMAADTENTLIGNIIVASNGFLYGVGDTGSNNGKLWVRADNNTTANSSGSYGGSSTWRALTTSQLSGAAINYDFIVENPDTGQVRSLYWASTNFLVASDPLGASSASTQALTFASIGQGLLHPKDKNIYFTYKNTTAHYVGIIPPNGTVFTGLNTTAFTLPFLYRAYCLSFYGNYLAIPLTAPNGIGVNGSLVALWSRDTSISTFDETIPWGAGNLKVLNNLQGTLVGISTASANYVGSFQDYDSVLIKIWQGGSEPVLIKEIKAIHLAATSHPTCSINSRVNFIYNNRLYFSVNIDPGDGIQPTLYGLWSVGKNKVTGEWTVVCEYIGKDDNTSTSIIAAAKSGDFVSLCHTAAGTLATVNQLSGTNAYTATSVYESLVNPNMVIPDRVAPKKLIAVACTFLPLPSGAQIVMKYRKNSNGATSDWQTIRTYTTANGVQFEAQAPASGQFGDFYTIEFRLESTGGAIITSFAYKYDVLTSNIL